MSSVDVDPTLSMVAEQAIAAAASAIMSAGGVDATVSSAMAGDPSTVTDGLDIVFRTRFGSADAALVISEGLAETLAGGNAAGDADAALTALTSLTELASNAVVERLGGIVEGLGTPVAVEPLVGGLGDLASGDARRVDVVVAGATVGWLMWIASPGLLAGLNARGGPAVVIDAIDYPDLGEGTPAGDHGADISFLSDVTMGVTVELGRTVMRVREVLQLTQGSVVELDRAAGALVDVLISGSVVARGEVVVMDDQLGVRVIEIVDSKGATR